MKNTQGSASAWKENLLNYLASDLGLELDRSLSIPRVFLRVAEHFAHKPALYEKSEGHFQPLSFRELKSYAMAFAAELIGQGLPLQGKVALFLKNSPDWAIADFGVLLAGGVTVPIYETLSSGVIRHILNDSGAELLMVEDRKFFEKIEAIRSELPQLQWIVARKPWPGCERQGVILKEEFLANGRKRLETDPAIVTSRLEWVRRDDLASIVYTSGTTGDPKGVMLTHRNFLSNVYGILSVTRMDHRDVFLSILPLAHTFERTLGHYGPLLSGASVAYSEGPEKLLQNLHEVRPTVCCGVPRIFEKVYTKMLGDLQGASRVKKKIFHWALETGGLVQERQEAALRRFGSDKRSRHRPEDLNHDSFVLARHPTLYFKHRLANFMVYRKIRKKLGGRLRYFVSGGAPLNSKITDFFHKLDVQVYEGYGLTETSPIISFNYSNKMKPGTVGKLLPSVQLKFSEEGEICVKGPNVMAGYYNNPQATREVVDSEGWFHTGDVGQWDENRFLKITDRIKELIVLSTGKKVPPLPIENKLTLSPLVAQTIVVGNREKFISAMIFPNEQELRKLAQEQGLGELSFAELCEQPAVMEKFSELIKGVNQDLSHYEKIKNFKLMPLDLSVEPELLTPTFKVKRRMVDKKFKTQIEALYQKEEE